MRSRRIFYRRYGGEGEERRFFVKPTEQEAAELKLAQSAQYGAPKGTTVLPIRSTPTPTSPPRPIRPSGYILQDRGVVGNVLPAGFTSLRVSNTNERGENRPEMYLAVWKVKEKFNTQNQVKGLLELMGPPVKVGYGATTVVPYRPLSWREKLDPTIVLYLYGAVSPGLAENSANNGQMGQESNASNRRRLPRFGSFMKTPDYAFPGGTLTGGYYRTSARSSRVGTTDNAFFGRSLAGRYDYPRHCMRKRIAGGGEGLWVYRFAPQPAFRPRSFVRRFN